MPYITNKRSAARINGIIIPQIENYTMHIKHPAKKQLEKTEMHRYMTK